MTVRGNSETGLAKIKDTTPLLVNQPSLYSSTISSSLILNQTPFSGSSISSALSS
jgi:hypothetical protein